MTRQGFLSRLREGLRGLPPGAVDDIMADYEAHFSEGQAAGRTDAEVAAALGDPGRLAREIRVEQGLKRWEEERTPSAAAGAVFAVLGLAAIDLLILLPILLAVGGVLFGLAIGSVGAFFAGGWMFVQGATGQVPWGEPGDPVQVLFLGLGLMAGTVAAGAILALIVTGLVNALVWYARLHYRLLKPAVER